MAQLEPLTRPNLRQLVRTRIRDAILDSHYKPGQRLNETAIAGQLGVSRAPVREALAALEREGIVLATPRGGHIVIEFTQKDIDEIYSLRSILEVGALQRAFDRFTEERIAEMQGIIDRLDQATRQRSDPNSIITLDLSFHDCIFRTADHDRLYSIWDNMHLQIRILIGLTSGTHIYKGPEKPSELHQVILNTIRDKDLKRAESRVLEHVQEAQRRASMVLQTQGFTDS